MSGMVLAFRDVTERKKAEVLLRTGKGDLLRHSPEGAVRGHPL